MAFSPSSEPVLAAAYVVEGAQFMQRVLEFVSPQHLTHLPRAWDILLVLSLLSPGITNTSNAG